MKTKSKKIKISKNNIFLSLYVISIVLVVGLFALQGEGAAEPSNSVRLPPFVSKNDSSITGRVSSKSETEVKPSADSQNSIKNILPVEPIYSYEVVSKSTNPRVYLGQKATLTLKIKNTGNTTWFSKGKEVFFLGTGRPVDRTTVFYNPNNKGWYSGNRISMASNSVRPGRVATFSFEITAPDKSGIYREFFNPVVEGYKWLDDKEIHWDIEVRDPDKKDEVLKITVNGGPVKYIKIKLSEQILYAYENGIPKYSFQTSTGMDGMNTPTGQFQIYNRFPVQYSAPYELYMDNWMAFTPTGAYGIHSLPYWPAKNGGRIYEGEDHLGTRVSHGCVRLSLENSKLLYDWAEIGTAVFIED